MTGRVAVATVLAGSLVALACVRRPPQGYGDVVEGPCRNDAECPAGHRCAHVHLGHLTTTDEETGESGISGDFVKTHCEALDAGARG